MPINLASLAGGFTESLGEHLLEYGVGVAVSEALRPEAVRLGQESWKLQPTRAVDPGTAAAIVAEDVEAREWGASEAVQSGIDGARFDAMVGEVLNAPGVGELFETFRRGLIDQATFVHGLRKAKLETMWDDALLALKDLPLEPPEIAKAIHRGIMRGSGLLIAEPSTSAGRVPMVPPSSLDPQTEAAWSGIDAERLRILVGNAGLPPGIVQGLQLLNRGAITEDDFSRLVAESNMRNEYTTALLALRRHLLTPHEYAEAELRGVMQRPDAQAGAALSGLEAPDYSTLFEILGRPLSVHQITTGLARGGTYGGTYDDVPEPYRDAIRRSSIRPEYAVLDHANRYTLPSAFFMRTLLQQGSITEQEFATWGKQEGWPPELADKIAAAIAGGTGSKGDPHVTKAETTAWTTAQRTYIAEETTAADVAPIFDLLAIPPDSQTQVLKVWDEVRALTRKQLTPAQVKKAIGQPGKDEAWALQQLLDRGYSRDDAQTFLAE